MRLKTTHHINGIAGHTAEIAYRPHLMGLAILKFGLVLLAFPPIRFNNRGWVVVAHYEVLDRVHLSSMLVHAAFRSSADLTNSQTSASDPTPSFRKAMSEVMCLRGCDWTTIMRGNAEVGEMCIGGKVNHQSSSLWRTPRGTICSPKCLLPR